MTASYSSAAKLRETAKNARRSMHAHERDVASRRITDRFLNSQHFFSSRSVACYLAAWDEVDTSAIIERAWRAKKRVFAPVVDKHGSMSFHGMHPETTLIRNRFGLWEPQSTEIIRPADIDIVVTPVVAFDEQRNRIGMGGGYFDRAFAFLQWRQCWLRPKLVGLAFECQKIEKISPKPWDIRLYRVFCESA